MANPWEGSMQKGPLTAAAASVSNGAGFSNGRLSVDEAERLAATFRPSWLLDDAPFAAMAPANTFTRAELQALEGGGTRPDVHAAVKESEATRAGEAGTSRADGERHSSAAHAPPPRTDVHEPENSVIIDRSITSADIDAGRSPPPASSATPRLVPSLAAPSDVPALPARAAPSVRPAPPSPLPQTASVVPFRAVPRAVVSAAQQPAFAHPADDLDVPRKSKTGLLIGLLAAAIVLFGGIALAIGLMSGSADSVSTNTKTMTLPTTPSTATTIPMPPVPTATTPEHAGAAAPAPTSLPTSKPQRPAIDPNAAAPQAARTPAPAATTAPKPKSTGATPIVRELKGL